MRKMGLRSTYSCLKTSINTELLAASATVCESNSHVLYNASDLLKTHQGLRGSRLSPHIAQSINRKYKQTIE